jgi:hypothetical protein
VGEDAAPLRTVAGRAGRVARDVTHGLRLLGCAAVTRGGDVETTARPGPQRSSEALRCGTGPCCGGGSPRYPQRAPGSRCGSPSIERDREARRPGGPTWQRLVGATSSGPVHRPHPIRGGPPRSAYRPVVARCCQWRTAPERNRNATVSAHRRSWCADASTVAASAGRQRGSGAAGRVRGGRWRRGLVAGSPPERPLPPPGRLAVIRSRVPGGRSGGRRSTRVGGWPARRGSRRARPRTGRRPARRCSSVARG